MPNFNRVIVCGHLGRDPEARYLPSNVMVCSFSMALSEKWTDKNSGQKQERTSWVDIEAFGKPAEILNQYLKKGSAVLIEGKLRQDTWEKDGQKRSKLKIVCENFTFLGGRDSGDQTQPAPAPAQPTTDVDPDSIPF